MGETPADLTTYSAKQPQQANSSSLTQKLFAGAGATTKNSHMFNSSNKQQHDGGSKRFNSGEENEYHHGGGAASSSGGGLVAPATTTTIHRVISDRNLGLGSSTNKPGTQHQHQQLNGGGNTKTTKQQSQ